MAICSFGSYESTVESDIDILPLIIEDASQRLGVNLSQQRLRHITILAEDGDIFTIDSFDYEIIDGVFATPILERFDVAIKSIIPRQSGEVKVLYVR